MPKCQLPLGGVINIRWITLAATPPQGGDCFFGGVGGDCFFLSKVTDWFWGRGPTYPTPHQHLPGCWAGAEGAQFFLKGILQCTLE